MSRSEKKNSDLIANKGDKPTGKQGVCRQGGHVSKDQARRVESVKKCYTISRQNYKFLTEIVQPNNKNLKHFSELVNACVDAVRESHGY